MDEVTRDAISSPEAAAAIADALSKRITQSSPVVKFKVGGCRRKRNLLLGWGTAMVCLLLAVCGLPEHHPPRPLPHRRC